MHSYACMLFAALLAVLSLQVSAKLSMDEIMGVQTASDVQIDTTLDFVGSYNAGVTQYNRENWAEAVAYMLQAQQKYHHEMAMCRSNCEALAVHTEKGDLMYYAAEPYNYIQYSYYRLNDLEKALENAYRYHFLKPDDADMKNNIQWYTSQLKDVALDVGKIQEEVIHAFVDTNAHELFVEREANNVKRELEELQKELGPLREDVEAMEGREVNYNLATANLHSQIAEFRDFLTHEVFDELIDADKAKEVTNREPTLSPVDRRKNLSFEEFWTEYVMKKKPVVIEDYMTTMLPNGVWNLDYWKKTCGQKKAWVVRRKLGAETWGGLSGGKWFKLNDYIEQFENGTLEENLYLHDWPLPKNCPEVLPDFVVPKYFAGDYLQRVPRKRYVPYRDAWPSLFIGRKGTNSALHIDSFGSNFWMLLLSGQKHWRFYLPEQKPFLYEKPDKQHFEVDVFNPDLVKHPLYRLADFYDCILQPGDLLYVPAGSPHAVRNIDDTIAISMNYVDESNLDMVLEESHISGNAGYEGSLNLIEEFTRADFPKEMNMNQPDLPYRGGYQGQVVGDPNSSYYA